MKINGQIQRMDSLMVESNIKTLSRMELLYTCLSDFVTYLHKNHEDGKLEGLEHYYNPADYNRVIYHQRSSGWKDWNITTIRPITTVSSTTSAAAVMRKDCRKS